MRSWSDDGMAVDFIERAVITVWIVSEYTVSFADVHKRPYAGNTNMPVCKH